MKDIGERAFLRRISGLVDESLLQFNDDASAILLPSGEVMVLNVDMLVFKTDVLPGMSFELAGRKAVTMSISDIIAKGAKPQGCLASLGLTPDTETINGQNILLGVKNQCSYYNAKFLGGDLNECKDIVLDIFSYGMCERNKLVTRSGAKNGDLLYSTGLFGLTSLGFKTLLEGLELPQSLKASALISVYNPIARIDFLSLFDAFEIKLCMDSSDGLFITLSDLTQINEIGIEINNVPIHPTVLSYAKENNLNPLELTFAGGEEFELLFAIDSSRKEEFHKKIDKLGLVAYLIGEFKEDVKGIINKDSRFNDFDLPKEGFEHFRSTA